MQGLVKLIMNSLYRIQIRKDINGVYKSKSEHWIKTEYDKHSLDYWRLPNENYIVLMKKDNGLDDDGCDIKKTLPAHLEAFILSNSKRFMNKFVGELNGFYKNNFHYLDTASLYIERIYCNVLNNAKK